MTTKVKLPQLGQTMEEATIVNCLVKNGDKVKKGDCIFEIETDKVTLEVESTAEGFVKHVFAENGQTLPVGGVLLILGPKNKQIDQAFIDSLKKANHAVDKGLGIETQTSTGKGRRITEEDIKNVAEAKPAESVTARAEIKLGDTIPINKLQKLTAERMLQSKREIPCFYLTVRADVTELVKLRAELSETAEEKIAYNDFIIKAVAAGLEKFPVMTGQLAGDVIETAQTINVGLAMSVTDALIVAVVRDAQKKDVKRIARDTKALVEKAGSGKLLLTDLESGCITVSNLGAFGMESFIPVVVPGQCSILGIGQIAETCVPEKDGISVRKLMAMTLSVDHKVANGTYAAQFLDFTRKYLEDISNFA
ncbi:MAG: dihydrolipoamide acetyltransferase family protein [Planctomycetota bacterium]|jgi:pyruvate dehydrogenase E2 component (dihydrolipoamide acetyltransferase)